MKRMLQNLVTNQLFGGVRTDNEASIKLAKKYGFIEDPNSLSSDKKWINYVKKYK